MLSLRLSFEIYPLLLNVSLIMLTFAGTTALTGLWKLDFNEFCLYLLVEVTESI